MFELLQRAYSSLTSFFLFRNNEINDSISYKRIRDQVVDITEDDDDDDDDAIIVSTPKKLKLHNRIAKESTRCHMKSNVTQTEDMTKKRSMKGGQQWRFEISSKENWQAPIEVVDLVEDSPNKFKNQYRPPQHVRSPHRIKKKSFCNIQKIDLTNDMNNSAGGKISDKGEVPRRLQRKSWPAITRNSTMAVSRNFSQEEALKRIQGFNTEDELSSMAHDEYSKLLHSFIHKDPQPMVVATAPTIKIDLTNDSGDENPASTSCSEKRSGRHYKLFEEPNRNETVRAGSLHGSTTSRRRVKPKGAGVEVKRLSHPIISLDDDDDDDDDSVKMVKTPPVVRINSFEDKIKGSSSVANEQWTVELMRQYEEKKAEMEEMTKRLAMELKIASERQSRNYNDMTLKLLTRHLEITEAILDDEDLIEPSLPELTPEMMEVVSKASRKHPPNEVLIEKFSYSIKRSDINTLTGLNWLNDEIINFYTTLIVERSKERPNLPKTHSFSTFFYLKLASSGYQGVKRWTKKVDIFAHDLIIIPVHLKMHWCLAAIDCVNKTINYYDSMGTTNDQCLKRLEDYLVDEYKDKKGQVLSMENWSKNNVKDIPRQMNGSDCGVFSCTFAEFLSRRAKFSFEQKNMPYIRQKMIYEIVTGKLIT